MQSAATELKSNIIWNKTRGRNHFFISSAYSISGRSHTISRRLGPMDRMIHNVGRYKDKLPTSSKGSVKVFTIPYPIHKINVSSPNFNRSLFAYFSGSLDVCCTGKVARCLLATTPNDDDVLIRSVARSTKGPCAKRFDARFDNVTLTFAPTRRE